MQKKPLKVAMICHFSNPKVQQRLKLKAGLLEYIVRKIKRLPTNPRNFIGEYSIWITNAIEEYEKMTDEIELHVVTPHSNMAKNVQEFDDNGIHYHFFQDENYKTLKRLKRIVYPPIDLSRYAENRQRISSFLKCIEPDIVYMIGVESPFYALSALDIPHDIPLMIQLQTLMCDPSFEKNYPISHDMYLYRSSVEINAIKRADYIGTTIEKMKNIIVRDVKSDAVFLKSKLAIGEKIFNKNIEKKFDFVYYAANISKAFDLALEGFAIAHEQMSNITLLVVGAYDVEYKNKMDSRIKELGLENAITFTGRLPTHDDVLNKIRESRFALIPLKIDIISGTIRESMANGLPVVTTITEGGTPMLNEDRETVLLSPIGNHNALAGNMLRLLNNPELAECLKKNGYIRIQERYSNASIVQQQKRALLAAYENFTNGIPIPRDVLS